MSSSIRIDRLDESVFSDGDDLVDVSVELVFVLFDHTESFVGDITGVVDDCEGVSTELKVSICCARGQTLGVSFIGAICLGVDGTTDIIENQEDTRWVLTFDQFTDNLVVKERNGGPLDTFVDVFLLFQSKSEFDEDLLEFFVDVVDTELFETVFIEHFESIDIQDSNDKIGLVDEGFVDSLHEPTEHFVIEGFSQRVTSSACLHLIQWDFVGGTALATTTCFHGTLN